MNKVFKLLAEYQLLVLILFLAVFLRLLFLHALPPSLNWDEVSHGYNAYSILKTGRDEWGELLPTIFRAYGDYKLPVYIYATVPFVALFGLNEFSVRLPSAIAGILTVLFTYLLVSELLRKNHTPYAIRYVPLITALFVALSPWSFFLSRVAVEANLALLLIVSGVWYMAAGLQNGKKKYLIPLGVLLLGLSVWTYNSARIFVPLLLLVVVILYKDPLVVLWRRQIKLIAYCLLLIVIFFIPMFYQLLNPAGQARYSWVAILDEGAIEQINYRRTTVELPGPLPRLIHNKATYFVSEFSKNYISHFSPEFLFFRGGNHYQFNIPGRGLIYPTELIFIVIGLVWLIKKRSRESLLILTWLILSPIASSFTREAPHALRSIVMQPVPQLLAATGLVITWNWLKKTNHKSPFGKLRVMLSKAEASLITNRIFALVYIVVLLFFVETYAREYVGPYRKDYSWAWQYGYKEAVQFIKEHYSEYDQIIMTKKYGEPHEFILFYMSWDPQKYREDPNLIRFSQSNWFWVDRFDKFYFVNDWQIPREPRGVWHMESGGAVPTEGRTLLITSPGNYPPAGEAVPSGWRLLKTINFLDNKPAFEILEST